MHVISARNVCDAWHQGVSHLHACGKIEDTRAGPCLVSPVPVTTVYQRPWERVLFCPSRDANPFFHLMESFWMLAGRSDARWLDLFVRDFSTRFAEPSGHMHGAYGQRWRRSFLHRPVSGPAHDQLATISSILRDDPSTRRAVLTMWDPYRDLGRSLRDHPCNTHCYFRGHANGTLDMMVSCRSNDIVWGAYGANAVHMSVMHEYVAAMAGMRQGTMTQVSWNWHAYQDVFVRILGRGVSPMQFYGEPPAQSRSLFLPATVGDVAAELEEWMAKPEFYKSERNQQLFDELLVPMMRAAVMWRAGDIDAAVYAVSTYVTHIDWRMATTEWLERRRRLQPPTPETVGDPATTTGD